CARDYRYYAMDFW
nr:immunoglobulin heavy chain junction region [Mus musculus]